VSLRWRLTLLYASLLVVIGLVVGTAVFFTVRAGLYQVLDRWLWQAAQDFARPYSEHPDQKLPGLHDKINKPPDAAFFTIFSQPLEQDQHLDPSPVVPVFAQGIRSLSGYRVAMLQADNGYWVQTARLETQTQATLDAVLKLLLLGTPVLSVIGLGVGYVFVGRAFEPVHSVAELAKRIALSGEVQERVPVPLGKDEMVLLTSTVNAMLERLELSLQRERVFALAAAHELRTPLTKLLARIELTLEQPRSELEYQSALTGLQQSASEMKRLVLHLLTFSNSGQVVNPQHLDLANLALECSEAASEALQAKQQKLELDLQSAPIKGDPENLRLAIGNILKNAILHTPVGSTIFLSTSTTKTQSILELADNGTGVSETDLERICLPFQRGLGLQNVEGSGLGLALVDSVVKQHQGSLELSHAKQGGLLVRLVFSKA
jgi:signal transduction histidine kinase